MTASSEALLHIRQIARRLWATRPSGQASVMVGAGFSRNATPVPGCSQEFPTWTRLVTLLGSALDVAGHYPSQPSVLEGPRLASQYEALFGRNALETTLLNAIPDACYEPGELHRRLLSLPWADVFTTNYDTLLERAQPGIIDRAYSVVLNPSDIATAPRPRIVKLHGSFPSHRPFIITEEDYRRYPVRFAPFVNLVQQAIMETAFCLVGFSGDDPNFLYWTGWVRDNLGSHAPPIYLIHLDPLPDAHIRLLSRRNIVPVDLSSLLVGHDSKDPDHRYRLALQCFFDRLEQERPKNPLRWPHPLRSPIAGQAVTPSTTSPPSPRRSTSTSSDELAPEDLRAIREEWRSERSTYPGWVVAPKTVRARLWDKTSWQTERILRSVDKLDLPDALVTLYELNWRLERCLQPLYANWADTIARVLECCSPFSSSVQPAQSLAPPANASLDSPDWATLRQAWVELAFAVAREAREDLDGARFSEWMTRLDEVVDLRAEWRARWHYEQCLYAFFRLDQDSLQAQLSRWTPPPELPVWQTRKAALLAEMGDIEQAAALASNSLESTRRALSRDPDNMTLMSWESWTMLLLSTIRRSQRLVSPDPADEEFRDRWANLAQHGCDPWSELRFYELELETQPPHTIPETESKKGFDLWSKIITHHLATSILHRVHPAFACLRLLEEAAIPVTVGIVAVATKVAARAALWVHPYAPYWSLVAAVRAGNTNIINELYTRSVMAAADDTYVAITFDRLRDAFSQALVHLRSNLDAPKSTLFSERLLRPVMEILSRLTFRLNAAQLEEMYALAVQAYQSPVVQAADPSGSALRVLFERLFETMSDHALLSHVRELVDLPLPGSTVLPLSRVSDSWVEPMGYLRLSPLALQACPSGSNWRASIRGLIDQVRSGAPISRGHAVLRLATLYELGGLSEEEARDFGEALWSRVDESSGLPSVPTLLPEAYLALPQPQPGMAESRLRAFLLGKDIPKPATKRAQPDGSEAWSLSPAPSNPYLRLLLSVSLPPYQPPPDDNRSYIDWAPEEAATLLHKLNGWWHDQRPAFVQYQSNPIVALDLLRQFMEASRVLGLVILPRLASHERQTIAIARELLESMASTGLPVHAALPMLLVHDQGRCDTVAEALRDGLLSSDETVVHAAMDGLVNWVLTSTDGHIPASPPDLLDTLVMHVLLRRQPGLLFALGNVVRLIRRRPQIFSGSQINSLLTALTFLLTETEFKPPHDTERHAPIHPEYRPEHRVQAARLAHSLYRSFSADGSSPPGILLRWRDACKDDVFPEVRWVWEDEVAPPRG